MIKNKKIVTWRSSKTRFGIIGFGRFGKLWGSALSPLGEVLVCDTKPITGNLSKNIKPSTLAEAVKTDMLFLAVPISELGNCCKAIRPFLEPRTLVADMCSVKLESARIMKKNLPANQPILATHPLFGPDSTKRNGGIKGLKIVVCHIRNSSGEREVMELFEKMGLKIIFSTPDSHDRNAASSQALVHLIGKGLRGLGLKPQEISTPDYPNLLHMCEIVSNDTWELFFDIQRRNPYAARLRNKFLENLGNLDFNIDLGKSGIDPLRKGIEKIDRKLIKLMGEREKFSRKIGAIKKQKRLKVLDTKREAKLEKTREALSKKYKTDQDLVGAVFRSIIKHSRNIQI